MFPTEDPKNRSFYSGESIVRNSSINKITNMLVKYPDTLLLLLGTGNFSYAQREALLNQIASNIYFNPLTNYNFMLLWQNRDIFTTAYESFCQKYLDVDQPTTLYINLCISVSLGVFVAIGVLFLTYSIVQLAILKNVIRVYESFIQKDAIGKIYHSLSKKLTIKILFPEPNETKFYYISSNHTYNFIHML